jgi:membrane-associated protein
VFNVPDLATLSTVAVYAVVWGFVFVECGLLVGFVLPGDSLLFGAGLLAASPHSSVNLPLLVAGTFIAAITGNDMAYRTGRRYGRGWIQRREEGRATSGLRKAETFYEQRGWWSVVIARWLSWVRTFVPVIAGTAAMDRRAFTSANIIGALPWAIGLPYLGALAYTIPWIRTIAAVIAVGSIGAGLVGAIYAGVTTWRRRSAGAGGDADGADHLDPPSSD